MMGESSQTQPKRLRMVLLLAYGIVAAGLGAAGAYAVVSQWHRGEPSAKAGAQEGEESDSHSEVQGHSPQEEHAGEGEHAEDEHGHEKENRVRMPEEQWKAAGVRVAPVEQGDLVVSVRVTGKVAINEDRVTHIHPLVSGRVHEVRVKFGDRVKANQVLAIVDSQEVGRAKLDLYQKMLETRLAEVNYNWQHEISVNTQTLIEDLSKGVPITEVQKRFRNKPMGNYRDRLLSAYSQLYKARADYNRLKALSEKGITAGKALIEAEAALESAEAAFWAAVEQIRFQVRRDELSARQELEKAKTAEAVSRELLAILGYHQLSTEDIDPAVQGEAISHYEVKAPFDGVIISKDVVLLDHVDPETQMFSVADFSTVWLRADVYEKYLPILQGLSGKKIRFRASGYPDKQFEATVFYTGRMVDSQTRTIDMRAIAQNPDGLLRPGMFVDIELPVEVLPGVVQVPRAALSEEQGQWYVFVQTGKEEFERRTVRVGRFASDRVEIREGLKPGELVAVAGLFALKTAAQGEVAHVHAH